MNKIFLLFFLLLFSVPVWADAGLCKDFQNLSTAHYYVGGAYVQQRTHDLYFKDGFFGVMQTFGNGGCQTDCNQQCCYPDFTSPIWYEFTTSNCTIETHWSQLINDYTLLNGTECMYYCQLQITKSEHYDYNCFFNC